MLNLGRALRANTTPITLIWVTAPSCNNIELTYSGGKIGDVVINRLSEGTAIVVSPDDNLRTVFMRMRSTGVSQLPPVISRSSTRRMPRRSMR